MTHEHSNDVKVVNLDLSAVVDMPELQIHRLQPSACVPIRGTVGAAGYDLCASESITVPKRGRCLVSTGLQLMVPPRCYGRIAPRSGLASKYAVDVGAGVIDADYRGEVKVLLINHGDTDFDVGIGDRVAQLIVERIEVCRVVESLEELPTTSRGTGGFGSTGLQSRG